MSVELHSDQSSTPIQPSWRQTPLVHFSEPSKLRKCITQFDPITECRGTISSFAERLQNTPKSQDWTNINDAIKRQSYPRRTCYRYVTLAKRTVERALEGKNIAKISAIMIASELGSTLSELGVVEIETERKSELPSGVQIEMVMERAKQIVLEWLTKDSGFHDELPAHPEFVYRITGDWQGWNHFLDVEVGTTDYDANAREDALEDGLFDVMKMILHYSQCMKRKNCTVAENSEPG